MKITVPTKTIYDGCVIHQSESECANNILGCIDSPIKSYSCAQFGDRMATLHIEFPDKSCVPYDAIFEFFDSKETKYFVEGAVDYLEELKAEVPGFWV
jgi:hypothetical protein